MYLKDIERKKRREVIVACGVTNVRRLTGLIRVSTSGTTSTSVRVKGSLIYCS